MSDLPVRRALPRRLRRFVGDARGGVIVPVALFMPLLLGFAGIAVDIEHARVTRERLRTAAEAAASAGVAELADAARARTTAIRFGEINAPAAGAVSATEVERGSWGGAPPSFRPETSGGPFNALRVTASLTEAKGNALPTTFAALFGVDTVELTATAIAMLGGRGGGCLLALAPSAAEALRLDSYANLQLDCGVGVVSNDRRALTIHSNARLDAHRICVAGGQDTHKQAHVAPDPETGCTPPADPFADIPTPAASGCDHNELTLEGRHTLQPGVYCRGLTIRSNSEITMEPGVYVLKDGPLTLNSNTTIDGEEVLIHLTGEAARLDIHSNAHTRLTAPTSGPYAGVVIYQDRRFGGQHVLNSNGSLFLDGAIYLPAGHFIIRSNAEVRTTCMSVVAHTLLFESNSLLTIGGPGCDFPVDTAFRSVLVR